jgi:hypothetical protein
MSLQQGEAGFRSFITVRNAGIFGRYRRSPNIFRGFLAACRRFGQVRAAAKYRAEGDRELMRCGAFSGQRRECFLTSLPVC